MKEMKAELKRIKEAIGFLLPFETGDHNIIIKRPINMLVPLL